ncbi:hypothetical protein [Streptomyces leeuwenhoekii]|uniref:Sle1_080 protein n=1 Tax=Streptomyces leeuwenhoekii TaxID=1437453 RepID=A0A0F7VPG3_STRLW|nr:hypothetical protein [Streptomyces leeuwenhoekii]CQR59247.1 sle1_080 [Streptomyces leeuwenhoekii]
MAGAPAEARREELCAWLTANNIRPKDVPLDADLYLAPHPDGTVHIHYEAFHLTADGHRHLDERGEKAAIERRSTPLLVDPPDWWEPYRKPTRQQLLDVIGKIRALHKPQPDGSGFPDSNHCGTCSQDGGDGYQYLVPWPCPTIRIIENEVNP